MSCAKMEVQEKENDTTAVEISVKSERIDPEIDGIQHNENATLQSPAQLIWIKPEIDENSQITVKQEPVDVTSIAIPEQSPASNGDQTRDAISKLPLKKRKSTLLEVIKDEVLSDKEVVSTEKEKMKEEPESNGTERSENADEKPQEKYIMYTYEITKNIQIVTITEEERQVEHAENLRQRGHMKYMCQDCAIGFVLEQPYKVHMKIHSKESGDHECEVCHTRLRTAEILHYHKLRHYRRYRCLLCWTRFKDKDTAACHVMTDHIGTSFTCDQCGRGFKRPQYLKRHIEQHHTKPHNLECPVCYRVFHERGWYRSHVRTHNSELRTNVVRLPVSCALCGRSFKNKSCLRRHIRAHTVTDVPCSRCQLVCKSRHLLAQHVRQVHKEKYEGAPEETCSICLRVCSTRAMLKRHMQRMHSNKTKNYQCDHCQRLYLTKGEVRSHIAWSHTAPSERTGHACPCGRLFRTPSLLKDHTARYHAAEPPPRNHACDVCGKTFANKQVLNRHKKSHSDEMYPCTECGLLFKTQPYVKVHYQLKHLNMTRAQINAQRKLNKQNRIPQNNLHVKTGWEPPSKKNVKNVPSVSKDPLLVQETIVKVEIESDQESENNGESDINIPLFETFVDVKRD